MEPVATPEDALVSSDRSAKVCPRQTYCGDELRLGSVSIFDAHRGLLDEWSIRHVCHNSSSSSRSTTGRLS
jgi:hypothetical protein